MQVINARKPPFPVIFLFLLFPICAAAQQSASDKTGAQYQTLRASAWDAADRLFHADPRWRGGDAAYSVNLGGGRILWLFGDSFIAAHRGESRRECTIVRNSVAIENGYDPSSASIRFYWRSKGGKPQSFVAGTGDTWLWPQHGVLLGEKLLLFFTRVRPDHRKNSLGFQNFGWTAFLVDNFRDAPSTWSLRRIPTPRDPWHIIVGAAATRAMRWLYVFGYSERKHDIYLLRWSTDLAAKGDLSLPEWWCGPGRGWVEQGKMHKRPRPVFAGGSTEFNVQWDAQLGHYVEFQSVGFGASDIAVRWAKRMEGPWSQPVKVYHPPESGRPGAFVYAAKGHPELTGADFIVTYVANSMSFKTLLNDPTIYFPRFVRFDLPKM